MQIIRLEHVCERIYAAKHVLKSTATIDEDHAVYPPLLQRGSLQHQQPCDASRNRTNCISGITLHNMHNGHKMKITNYDKHLRPLAPLGLAPSRRCFKFLVLLLVGISHRRQPQPYCRSFRVRCIQSSSCFNHACRDDRLNGVDAYLSSTWDSRDHCH